MNETLKRAISGAVYIILLISCIHFSKKTLGISLAVLIGIFLLIAVYEFCKMIKINLYISFFIAIVSYFSLWNQEKNLIIKTSLTLFSITISIKLLLYLFNQSKSNFNNLTKYLFLVGYIIFPLILVNFIIIGKERIINPKILISILILIWSNDTFAFLVGKNFGKNKLFPSVSPKKTIEGFIGGLFFTIVSSVFLSKFYIESKLIYIWIIIAVIVSVFSTLGDLIESKFKRNAGIKDSGTIMPGHGGLLDRLDSIIFVIPFINLYFLISHLNTYYVS
ncbi:MAG TPA: phosphatidate cytidylyltransferase [Flavobacterium sp.]|nr:phosphatidate cytidylyltransferase [Flavobacterium sp.]